MMTETVNHPAHYGGDTVYEVIKVAEAWGLDKDAYLFNVLKYIGRPGKGDYLEDLKKAQFYLARKIARLEGFSEPVTTYQAAGVGWGSDGGADHHGEVIEVKPASRHSHSIDELCGPPCPGWHRSL